MEQRRYEDFLGEYTITGDGDHLGYRGEDAVEGVFGDYEDVSQPEPLDPLHAGLHSLTEGASSGQVFKSPALSRLFAQVDKPAARRTSDFAMGTVSSQIRKNIEYFRERHQATDPFAQSNREYRDVVGRLQANAESSTRLSDGRPHGFMSRPNLKETRSLFESGDYLSASYFQLQNPEVLASLPENFELTVQIPNRTFMPKHDHLENGQQMREQEMETALSIYGGNLAAMEAVKDMSLRQSGSKLFNYKVAPMSFHPKVGYTEKDEQGQLAWIGTQNITMALAGNSTMENLLVFRGGGVWGAEDTPLSRFEQRMFEQIKRATTTLHGLGQYVKDKGYSVVKPGQFQKNIGTAGYLRADGDILKGMNLALGKAVAAKDQVVISTWQFSLATSSKGLKGDAATFKQHIRSLMTNQKLKVVLDRGTFQELESVMVRAMGNNGMFTAADTLKYDTEMIKQLFLSGSVLEAPSPFHHEKSLFIYDANRTKLKFLMTGSANFSQAAMVQINQQGADKLSTVVSDFNAAGIHLPKGFSFGTLETELNAFIGVGQYGGDKEAEAYLDYITPQVNAHLKYNLREGVHRGFAMEHTKLVNTTSLKQLRAGLTILQQQLDKAGVRLAVEEKYAPNTWVENPQTGVSGTMTGLRITIASRVGIPGYNTSINVTVGPDGSVVLLDRRKVMPGALFVNKGASTLRIPGMLNTTVAPSHSFAMSSIQAALSSFASIGLAMNEQAMGSLVRPTFSQFYAPVQSVRTGDFLEGLRRTHGRNLEQAFRLLAKGDITNAGNYGIAIDAHVQEARFHSLNQVRKQVFNMLEAGNYSGAGDVMNQLLKGSEGMEDIMGYLLLNSPLKQHMTNAARVQVGQILETVFSGAIDQNSTGYGYAQLQTRVNVIGATKDDKFPNYGLAAYNPLPLRSTGGLGLNTRGSFLRLIGAQGYDAQKGLAGVGGLRQIEMTVSSLNEDTIALYDFQRLAQSFPQTAFLSQQSIKDNYRRVLAIMGGTEELPESAEVLAAIRQGAYFFSMPSTKIEQFMQRFKNLTGARRAQEINPDFFQKLLSGQALDNINESEIFADEVHTVMNQHGYERYEEYLREANGNHQVALRLMRERETTPFAAGKSLLAPTVKRIEQVVGMSTLGDVHYANPNAARPYGFTTVTQIKLYPKRHDNKTDAVNQVLSIFKGGAKLVGKDVLLADNDAMVLAFKADAGPGNMEHYEAVLKQSRSTGGNFGKSLQIKGGRFYVRSGLYTQEDGSWVQRGRFLEDGRIQVGLNRSTTAGGQEFIGNVTFTNRAFNLRDQNAVTYFYGDVSLNEDPISRSITIGMMGVTAMEDVSGNRRDAFKGPGLFVDPNTGLFSQFGEDVYAVVPMGAFKQYSYETAGVHLQTNRAKYQGVSGLDIALSLFPLLGEESGRAAYTQGMKNKGVSGSTLLAVKALLNKTGGTSYGQGEGALTGDHRLGISHMGLNILLGDSELAKQQMQAGSLDAVRQLITRAVNFDAQAIAQLSRGFQNLLSSYEEGPLNLSDPAMRALLTVVDVYETQSQLLGKMNAKQTARVQDLAIPESLDEAVSDFQGGTKKGYINNVKAAAAAMGLSLDNSSLRQSLQILQGLSQVYTTTRYERVGPSPSQNPFSSKERVDVEFQNLFQLSADQMMALGINDQYSKAQAALYVDLVHSGYMNSRNVAGFMPSSAFALPVARSRTELGHFQKVMQVHGRAMHHTSLAEKVGATSEQARTIYYIMKAALPGDDAALGARVQELRANTGVSHLFANMQDSQLRAAVQAAQLTQQGEEYVKGLGVAHARTKGDANLRTQQLYLPMFNLQGMADGSYRVQFSDEDYTRGILLGYDVLNSVSLTFRGYEDEIITTQQNIVEMATDVLPRITQKIVDGQSISQEEAGQLQMYSMLLQKSSDSLHLLLQRKIATRALGAGLQAEGATVVAVNSWMLDVGEAVVGQKGRANLTSRIPRPNTDDFRAGLRYISDVGGAPLQQPTAEALSRLQTREAELALNYTRNMIESDITFLLDQSTNQVQSQFQTEADRVRSVQNLPELPEALRKSTRQYSTEAKLKRVQQQKNKLAAMQISPRIAAAKKALKAAKPMKGSVLEEAKKEFRSARQEIKDYENSLLKQYAYGDLWGLKINEVLQAVEKTAQTEIGTYHTSSKRKSRRAPALEGLSTRIANETRALQYNRRDLRETKKRTQEIETEIFNKSQKLEKIAKRFGHDGLSFDPSSESTQISIKNLQDSLRARLANKMAQWETNTAIQSKIKIKAEAQAVYNKYRATVEPVSSKRGDLYDQILDSMPKVVTRASGKQVQRSERHTKAQKQQAMAEALKQIPFLKNGDVNIEEQFLKAKRVIENTSFSREEEKLQQDIADLQNQLKEVDLDVQKATELIKKLDKLGERLNKNIEQVTKQEKIIARGESVRSILKGLRNRLKSLLRANPGMKVDFALDRFDASLRPNEQNAEFVKVQSEYNRALRNYNFWLERSLPDNERSESNRQTSRINKTQVQEAKKKLDVASENLAIYKQVGRPNFEIHDPKFNRRKLKAQLEPSIAFAVGLSTDHSIVKSLTKDYLRRASLLDELARNRHRKQTDRVKAAVERQTKQLAKIDNQINQTVSALANFRDERMTTEQQIARFSPEQRQSFDQALAADYRRELDSLLSVEEKDHIYVHRVGAPVGAAGETIGQNFYEVLGVEDYNERMSSRGNLAIDVARSQTLLMLPSAGILSGMLGDFDGDMFQMIGIKKAQALRAVNAAYDEVGVWNAGSSPYEKALAELNKIREVEQKVNERSLTLFQQTMAANFGIGQGIMASISPEVAAQMLNQGRAVSDNMVGRGGVITQAVDNFMTGQGDRTELERAMQEDNIDVTDREQVTRFFVDLHRKQYALGDVQKNYAKLMGSMIDLSGFDALQASMGHVGTQLIGQTYNTILPLASQMFNLGNIFTLMDSNAEFKQKIEGMLQNRIVNGQRYSLDKLRQRFDGLQGFLQNMQQAIRDSLKAKTEGGAGLLESGELQQRLETVESQQANQATGFQPTDGLNAADNADLKRLEVVRGFIYENLGETVAGEGKTSLSMFGAFLELAEVSSKEYSEQDIEAKFIQGRHYDSQRDNVVMSREQRFAEEKQKQPSLTAQEFMAEELKYNLITAQTEFVYQNVSGSATGVPEILGKTLSYKGDDTVSLEQQRVAREYLNNRELKDLSQEEQATLAKQIIRTGIEIRSPLDADTMRMLATNKTFLQSIREGNNPSSRLTEAQNSNRVFGTTMEIMLNSLRMNKVEGAENQMRVGMAMLTMMGDMSSDQIGQELLTQSGALGATEDEQGVWRDLVGAMFEGDAGQRPADTLFRNFAQGLVTQEFIDAQSELLLNSRDMDTETLEYHHQRLNEAYHQSIGEATRWTDEAMVRDGSRRRPSGADFDTILQRARSTIAELNTYNEGSGRGSNIFSYDSRMELIELAAVPLIVGALSGTITADERLALTGIDLMQSLATASTNTTLLGEFIESDGMKDKAQAAARSGQAFRIRQSIEQDGLLVGAGRGILQEGIYQHSSQIAYKFINKMVRNGERAGIPGLKGVGIIASELIGGMLAMSASKAILNVATGRQQEDSAQYDRAAEIMQYLAQQAAQGLSEFFSTPSSQSEDDFENEMNFETVESDSPVSADIELGTYALLNDEGEIVYYEDSYA